MENLIIPFSVQEIENNIPYFAVVKIPFSSLIAYLTRDSLFLRNSSTANHDIVLRIIRSQESLQNYGPNQWMQYIDRFHICFGTKSGLISVLRLTDLTAYSKKLENIFFTSIFNCHKHLAAITPKNELFFIQIDDEEQNNTNKDKIFQNLFNKKNYKCQTINVIELKNNSKKIEIMPSKYDMNFAKSTILNTVFYHRLNKPKLVSIIDNKPCFIPITPSTISSTKKLQPSFFKIEKPVMLAVNPASNFLAAALKDSSVVFISLLYPDSTPILISKYDPGVEIIFMRWTYDDENLIIITSTGCVTLFEMPTYTVYNMHVPDFIMPTKSPIQTIINNNNPINSNTNISNNTNAGSVDNNNNNNSSNNSTNINQYPLICRIVSVDYDEESRCLYAIKRENNETFSLHAVEFALLQKRFCFTASRVFDYKTKFIIPLQIFPIKFVIPFSIKEKIRESPNSIVSQPPNPSQTRKTKLFIASSNNQIQADDKIITFNDDDIIQGIQLLNGLLFVFIFSTKEEQIRLVLFDENLNQMKMSVISSIAKSPYSTSDFTNIISDHINFPHSIHTLTNNYINQLAAACHTMYSLIKMNPKKVRKNRINREQNAIFEDECPDIDLTEGFDIDNDSEDKEERFNILMKVRVFNNYDSNDNDDYTFSIKTLSVRQQLKNAVSCAGQGVFLHYTNGNGQLIKSKYIFNNIKYAFYEPFSDIIVVQMAHTYYIVKDYYQTEFKGVACFSDMVETFSLQKLTLFGEIAYVGTLFMPFLLINNFEDSNKILIPRLEKVCPSIERFDNIIASTISTAIIQNHEHSKIINNVQPIITPIPSDRASKIFENVIEKLKVASSSIKIISSSSSEYSDEDEDSGSEDTEDDNGESNFDLVKKLLQFNFSYEKFFKELNTATKRIILEYLDPVDLENLLLEVDTDSFNDTIFSRDEKKELLIKLIKKFHFLRAFKICESLKFNFPSLIKEVFYKTKNDQITLKKILMKIRKDRKEFNLNDDDGLLRFMGSAFGASNLFLLSFAVFVVLKEQSKIELMLMTNADPEVENEINEFVKANPNSRYSNFLISLPNSPFKQAQ